MRAGYRTCLHTLYDEKDSLESKMTLWKVTHQKVGVAFLVDRLLHKFRKIQKKLKLTLDLTVRMIDDELTFIIINQGHQPEK